MKVDQIAQYNKKQNKQSITMSEIKIQPWHDDIEQDINYVKKLNTLSNFSSSSNLKKNKIKKKCMEEEILVKLSKFGGNGKDQDLASAETTMQNFHKTNRSEYRHRVTKLVFSQQNNKRYKFQPEVSPIKKRLGLLTSHKFLKKSLETSNTKNLDEEPKKSKKQIYYNLTQMNSPLNSVIKLKCMTEQFEDGKSSKIKIFSKVREEKKIVNPPLFRELSVERKIYILQSGGKPIKETTTIKKNHRKCRNIIEQICKAERDYSRQIKRDH